MWTSCAISLSALQSDPGPHLHPETRKTHLVLGYVRLSNDYRSLLLRKRPQTPLYKTSRERGSQVSLPEAKKSFYLWFCHGLPEQGKSISSGLVHQELFFQAIFVPHSQEVT